MSDKPKITEGPVSVSVDRVEAIEKQAKFIKRLTNPSPLIEYTEFEKLKAENERLMRERDSYAGYAKLNDELMEERDTIKAKLAALDRDHADDWKRIQDAERKLAEVEAERDGALRDLFQALTERDREREAARVMREALLHIKEVQETLGGESVLLDDVNDALAKADEIRGKK